MVYNAFFAAVFLGHLYGALGFLQAGRLSGFVVNKDFSAAHRSSLFKCLALKFGEPKSIASPIADGTVKFAKYQGIGNDFILIDNRFDSEPCLTPEQSEKLCDRNFGIGGDGVIFALPGKDGHDYTMRIYNSDATEPEMCGNGIRCMARFLMDLEGRGSDNEEVRYKIWTLAGTIEPVVRGSGGITVDMGEPELEAEKVPTTLPPTQTIEAGGKTYQAAISAPITVNGVENKVSCVSMGNPHAVVFIDENEFDSLALHNIGPLWENHEAFPARINTEFVHCRSPSLLRMKVWERGAGPTLACGTGTCALVVAAILNDHCERNNEAVKVQLPGGDLDILWSAENNRVYMTGPAELVFAGESLLL